MGTDKSHGYSNYIVKGYLACGKRRASHLGKNCAAISKLLGTHWHYAYAATITILPQLTVGQHKGVWTCLVKEFVRLGLSASWEREITRENQINYHLVIRNAPAGLMKNKARKLRDLIRKTTTVKLNQKYDRIDSYVDACKWINYCSKLEFAGSRKVKSDELMSIITEPTVKDIYKHKRVLFRKMGKGQRLLRFGDFGGFWQQSPTASNAQRKAKKATLDAKRLASPEVQEAARELGELTGRPSDAIERQLHAEYDRASASELPTLVAENVDLAVQHHGSQQDYINHLTDEAVYRAFEADRLKKISANRQSRVIVPRTPKPRIPFDPALCESYTIGLNGMELIKT